MNFIEVIDIEGHLRLRGLHHHRFPPLGMDLVSSAQILCLTNSTWLSKKAATNPSLWRLATGSFDLLVALS